MRRKDLVAYLSLIRQWHKPAVQVPQALVDCARRSARRLINARQAKRPLIDLFTNAYLNGVADAISAILDGQDEEQDQED